VVLLEWVLNNWYWAVAAYLVAFAVAVALNARSYVRTERAKLAAADSRRNLGLAVSRTDSGSYSDGDSNRAAGGRRVDEAGRRSVWGPANNGGAGRHVSGGDLVCADAPAVTS
jgi:hypothetical protein